MGINEIGRKKERMLKQFWNDHLPLPFHPFFSFATKMKQWTNVTFW
ncbi:Predicted protein [Anoxybacillus flavithermus WK1]|uniref:Uncharacterized protein n=1 Tax=Anoxybacillus flavithermus (strain DSM 21510 / WK1) TaxID=491915 RepID=B7GHU1_ANOFW|nr:Predicted protein [Anoxybacillus flavithermus WK1]